MKMKLLIATTAALAVLGASVADAASRKHKRQKVYRSPPPVVVPGVVPSWHHGYGYYARNRPPWAGPNECWNDEGYGRFSSCDMTTPIR